MLEPPYSASWAALGFGSSVSLARTPQTFGRKEAGTQFSARSAEFIHSPVMKALVWARVPGDVVFSVGVFAFAWFMFRAFLPGKSH